MKPMNALMVILIACLLLAGPGASRTSGMPPADDGGVFLRLQAGTFDPLQETLRVPARLELDAYPQDSGGPYIVQFSGPIQESWKQGLEAAGGRILGYLPDYAYLAWMDGGARLQAADLEGVRWVGPYQPAYKISQDLVEGTAAIVKVSLFPGADLAEMQTRLAGLNTPTTVISGETFLLMLPEGNLSAVAAWPEVEWIERFVIPETNNDIATGIMGGATAWAAGLNGSGMTVTVADTGIDSGTDTAAAGDMHADFDNRFTHISSWPVQGYGSSGCWNVGADDTARDLASGHGTHVLGSVAGNGAASSGQIRGLANQATLTFQGVEQYVNFTPSCESTYGYTDGYYLFGLPEDLNPLFLESYNWGSRIHSNSWGSSLNGQYTTESQDVDEFTWAHPDMTILFSAGNEGTDANDDGYVDTDSMGSPGTAKNAITSGAAENVRASGGYASYTWGEAWSSDYQVPPTSTDYLSNNQQHMAAFSSRGPTDDGRIKPDVVAPGTNILSTKSGYTSSTGWGPYNASYMYMGGTSMSNPLIAGAATLVREYYVEKRGVTSPSAALIKATLINTATDTTGYGNATQEAGQPIPNMHEGWGEVNVGAAVTGNRFFVDGSTLTAGGFWSQTFQVTTSAYPLKFSLAWSDYPGAPAAGTELVNNLNLKVTAPNGTTIYWGNNFSGGWSASGGTADTKNNVENVYVNNPATGTWTVRVEGANVPNGPQPFALVGPDMTVYHNQRVYIPAVLSIGQAPASLTLVKTVINNNGGSAVAGNFTLSASGPTPISGAGGASGSVTPGLYTLWETSLAGYTSGNYVCSGGTQAGNQVTLGPGQSATCTVTNDDTVSNPLVNPDFEAGHTGWTESSTHGWALIMDNSELPVTPHGGLWGVWLGGDYSDISYIQQSVTVPVGAPYLAYWHWIGSAETTCGADFGGVRVNGSWVSQYNLCTATLTGGWVHHVVNLSAYTGQSVTLQIRAETNSSLNSNLFIDDVSFQSTASPVSERRAGPRSASEALARNK